MKNFIVLKHNAETKETIIQWQEKVLDTSGIQELPVAEWENPFVKNGVRWYGLYAELNKLCEGEPFSIIFYGSESDMQTLKKMLADKNIEIFSEHNKVVLLYNHADFSVRITVNGKIFDTSRINGVPIQQAVNQIESRNWKGIFPELQEYMNHMPFSVTFIGDSEDMNYLIPVCPENVDLSYKSSKFSAPKISTQAVSETANALLDSAKTAMQNVNVPEKVTVGGRTFSKSMLAKIAILLSLICFVFPFISVSCGTEDSKAKKNYSGIQIMTAIGQENDEWLSDMDKKSPPNAFLCIAFLAGILTLLVLMAHRFWGKLPDSVTTKLTFISNNPNRFGGILSAAGAVSLLIFRFSLINYYQLSDYKNYIIIKTKLGFLLSLLFMTGGAVLCFLSQDENALLSASSSGQNPAFESEKIKQIVKNPKVLIGAVAVVAAVIIIPQAGNLFKTNPLQISNIIINPMDMDYYYSGEYEFTIKNVSKKQINYIDFELYYYDKLGGQLTAGVIDTQEVNWTGPLEVGEETTLSGVLLHTSEPVAVMLPKIITVTFADDKQVTFQNDVYGSTPEFSGGKLKDKRN